MKRAAAVLIDRYPNRQFPTLEAFPHHYHRVLLQRKCVTHLPADPFLPPPFSLRLWFIDVLARSHFLPPLHYDDHSSGDDDDDSVIILGANNLLLELSQSWFLFQRARGKTLWRWQSSPRLPRSRDWFLRTSSVVPYRLFLRYHPPPALVPPWYLGSAYH